MYLGWVDWILSFPLSAKLCPGWWEFGRCGWAVGSGGGTLKWKSTQPRFTTDWDALYLQIYPITSHPTIHRVAICPGGYLPYFRIYHINGFYCCSYYTETHPSGGFDEEPLRGRFDGSLGFCCSIGFGGSEGLEKCLRINLWLNHEWLVKMYPFSQWKKNE